MTQQHYFTSDLHFGHAGVISHCNRPFTDVEHMNAEMVRRWNVLVEPKDNVYILGDFALCRPLEAINLLHQLKGRKHLIVGNHDKKLLKSPDFEAQFEWIKYLHTVKIPTGVVGEKGQRIVLCHYALRTWERHNHGAWHLHGHSHGSLPRLGKSMDVGVDSWWFAPVSYPEIKAYMDSHDVHCNDHHVSKEKHDDQVHAHT